MERRPLQSLYTPFQKKLRSLLKRARKASRLSQKKLARLVGTNQSTISNIEKCQRYLDIGELMDITAALKVDPRALLAEADPASLPPVLPVPPSSPLQPKRRSRQRAKAK